ncbi:MAG: M20/M25/M40 family metallo-hydrolase [Flavobacteriales bacterium]|jgi:putative aminopeptidase FrvX|nr:M20/M25/M40 family metallo-hydrolase [Flavobacteriales bacterium]|tara:strand:+ start:740 stop:1648 length:909 start_codon:yes stop_codon:yes gene_type:complete
MELLKQMCEVHAPAGEELAMKEFLLNYINENQNSWKVKPILHHGAGFQDNLMLVFGEPRTAIFAHLDSIGFTVKYNNEIVKIGGPVTTEDIVLVGEDSQGKIEGKIIKNEDGIFIDFNRTIDRGTSLTFKVDFRDTDEFIQSCYMDNRLGVWNALEVAKTLENGIIVFSTWEEHGGGSVGYLGKFIQEKYGVNQALISDITWVTEGVKHGKGCAISLRDSGIPRKSYINKVVAIAKKSGINFQLEVEDAGGSDGNGLQKSDYPWDWCFVGAPEDNVHSPDEKVHKDDIKAMVALYSELMEKL